VVTPPGLSPFWPVRTSGYARWRSESAARPALRQSHGVSRESPGGRLWRSAGLWDGPETLRDASEAVYTKEPMVDVGAWDIAAMVFVELDRPSIASGVGMARILAERLLIAFQRLRGSGPGSVLSLRPSREAAPEPANPLNS